MEGPLPFPSPLTPPIVPFGNGRFNPTPDPTWSAAFSPFRFRVNPLMLFSKTGHFAPSNKVLVALLEDAFAFQNDGCSDTDGGG
jgi:hypothetical protein